MLAEGHRRAGKLDQAQQLARLGLDEQPESAEGAVVMALVLLDQGQVDQARRVMESWADSNLGVEVTDQSDSAGVFGLDLSAGEFERAFDSAETDPDEVIDADAIAQQAMLETELELVDEFASPNSNFATRTVAQLLAQQGDERGASRIRALMESSSGGVQAKVRNRSPRKIERLERWLMNIRGGMQ